MPHSNIRSRHQTDAGTPVPTQPIIGTDKHRPVPSLHALEQPGGPEIDGPLMLPDAEVWSSRLNEVTEAFREPLD